MMVHLGCTQEDMKSIDRIIANSTATHSTDVPKRKAVVDIPSAKVSNEDVKTDLWYIPGGGKNDYLLHLCDAVTSVSVCCYLKTRVPDVVVRKN